MEPIKISAKNIAATALEDFCPRCYWIKLHAPKLPWQSFPGIFSSIDAYTKNCIHYIISKRVEGRPDSLPAWMQKIGDVASYETVPHWSKNTYHDEKSNITLSGVPDDIFVLSDSSRAIIDWKTAKITNTQDKLLPLYNVQLNVYGILCGTKETKLYLVYMEPQTDKSVIGNNIINNGFSMEFHAAVVKVENDRSLVRQALTITREIYEQPTPPNPMAGCKDCASLDGLINMIQGRE
jgi:hypothetical protein